METRLVPILLVLLIVSVSPARAEGIEDLVADLGSTDSSRRISALNELRRLKDPRAVPLIISAIESWEYSSRYYGVLVLEGYPPGVANRAFTALVKSKSPFLRLCAGAALFRNGDSRAARVVVRALTADVPEQTRVNMLYRLYSVRDARVQEAVRGFLRPEESITVIAAALNVLHSQQSKKALPPCRRLLREDERSGVRALAAAYLYRFGEEERAADLAREIRSGEIGSTEFMRIETMLKAAGGVAEEILAALADLLSTEDNVSVLGRVIGLLGDFRYRKAASALKSLLGHENRTVAKAAFDALASLPGALDEEVLLPMLAAEDVDRRLWAAHALRRMDNSAGFEVVLEVLREGADTQRYEAARILGGFRMAAAVAPLIDALLDDYQTTRSYAFSSLATVLRSLFPYRRFDLASVGYGYQDPEAARKQAAERIRAWWREHRARGW